MKPSDRSHSDGSDRDSVDRAGGDGSDGSDGESRPNARQPTPPTGPSPPAGLTQPPPTQPPRSGAATAGLAEDATVVLSGVSKWFGHKVAVADVTVSFGPGVTGLLGPNGAGKTTLLRLVVGLQHPSRGGVTVLGRDVLTEPDVHRHMALVPEAPNVHAHLSARQFIALSARLHRVDDPDAATAQVLETVALVDDADRPLRTYSKGMRQRAKVAAALVVDPQVLVLDEPLNGADPVQRATLIDLFTRMGASGRTVIVSSHVLSEVDRMAQRVVAMVDGRLAAVGSARALRAAMTDRPREVVVEAHHADVLAAALIADGLASGVDVDGARITVRTRDAARLALALPGVATAQQVGLQRVEPVDESLESVFRDIAGGV